MSEYVTSQRLREMPRLPLEGNFDLTYRCNNNCRHCWLRIPPDAKEKEAELSFEEIRKIADEAKKMGCRKWAVSGGEPMLRPDFAEIFDYLTKKASSYSINTNGTLITPRIAQLMKRKGSKMVAIYGATAEVHDHVTRNPGSFETTMRGFRYLKENSAGFIVQIIPMKDNYHQFQDMVRLAKSLSKDYRVGAPWLYLSASGDAAINQEIMRQRLFPKDVVELDTPDLSYEDWLAKSEDHNCSHQEEDGCLFASCIETRRSFHIDPYGLMTFCCFIKDPALRYDLRKGSVGECWNDFIPSLKDRVKVSGEYSKSCLACDLRKDCRWCPVYGYLEHRNFSAKVDYLCAVARENRRFKNDWQKAHRRYYKIADITIQVDSDLAINDDTFHPKFKKFEIGGPSGDVVTIRHHFLLPDLERKDLGEEVYRKAPWAIYRKDNAWVYLGISPNSEDRTLHRVAVFNSDHSRARIYHDNDDVFLKGDLHSLTLFATDQILLARILADRNGCYIHSCGVDLDGKGLLFVGHSEAGKSTMANIMKGKAEILCDDRVIVRKNQDGFKIYGTWSHGDVPDVSSNSAPLKAILFLNKSDRNYLKKVEDKREITRKLLACLIKPFVTTDWWDKTLSLVEDITREIPCYEFYFDKTGEAADALRQL